MRLAVIGDIHANAEALEIALRESEGAGYDLRIFLGDLLTYGVEVDRTLDLVSGAVSRGDSLLLLGNHDDIYMHLLEGRPDRVPPHQDWLEAHIGWTLAKVPARDWLALPFRASFAVDGIYFAHANPFGRGDWRYLTRPEAKLAAAIALEEQGMSCGVFGHTHRARRFSLENGTSGGDDRPFDFEVRYLDANHTHVLNGGSVGQPRSDHPREVVLWLDVHRNRIAHRYQPVTYDVEAHRQSLLNSSLPEPVKRRCLAFHRSSS